MIAISLKVVKSYVQNISTKAATLTKKVRDFTFSKKIPVLKSQSYEI